MIFSSDIKLSGSLDYGQKPNEELIKKAESVYAKITKALSKHDDIQLLTDHPDIKIEQIWFTLAYTHSANKTIVNRHYSLEGEIKDIVDKILNDIVGRRP
jgi:hypothetical protein